MKARHVLLALTALGLAGLAKLYVLVVRGALTIDLGIGRRVRPLGPISIAITAAPETVFDVIAAPYLGKTPQAMADKLRVVERGADMVLADHFTHLGRGGTAVTSETVRFERPHTVSFRLVRGPVPHVVETFDLQPSEGGTSITYTGEMGADCWAVGTWWMGKVAAKWEQAVTASLASIREEAERKAAKPKRRVKTSTAAPPPPT